MEPKSPREFNALPEKPSESDLPVTSAESDRITSALANPDRSLKRIENGNRGINKLSVLVLSKLGPEMVEAGANNKKLAKTIVEALNATHYVRVGHNEYKEVTDHKLRLTAWHLAMKSAGADAPVHEGDKSPDDENMSTLLKGMGIAALEEMRRRFAEELRRNELRAGTRIETVVVGND